VSEEVFCDMLALAAADTKRRVRVVEVEASRPHGAKAGVIGGDLTPGRAVGVQAPPDVQRR